MHCKALSHKAFRTLLGANAPCPTLASRCKGRFLLRFSVLPYSPATGWVQDKTVAMKSVLLCGSKHLALHTILRFLSSIPNLTVVAYNNILGILRNCKDNL